MPVDYSPCFVILVLVVAPFVAASKGRRALKRTLVIEGLVVAAFLLSVYLPGAVLMVKAHRGDPQAQYEFSRWCVNSTLVRQTHTSDSDLARSFFWLSKAAEQHYPPAMYALGVEYKFGEFVPKPDNWKGPGGNASPQPEKGQPLIDTALKAGYLPPVAEESFYWQFYRK